MNFKIEISCSADLPVAVGAIRRSNLQSIYDSWEIPEVALRAYGMA